MLKRSGWMLVTAGATTALGLFSTALLTAWVSAAPPPPPPPPVRTTTGTAVPAGQVPLPVPPPPPPGKASAAAAAAPVIKRITQQAYIGTGHCAACHHPQASTWAETKHSHAFSDLPAKYRDDASCRQCHLTAFGQPGGYVATTSKETLAGLTDVGCEACHGPGALHENAAQRFTVARKSEEESIEKEIKATIQKLPSDKVCSTCHQAQAHGAHPWYEGQPARPGLDGEPAAPCPPAPSVVWAAPMVVMAGPCCPSLEPESPPIARYKACAACHYQKYKTWQLTKHALSVTSMPAKYQGDAACLKCHATGHGTPVAAMAGPAAPGVEPQSVVACESCHGPGAEHVAFNEHYINWPALGPDIEQTARQLIRKGHPANSCVQCHARQSHKEHPAYDKAS